MTANPFANIGATATPQAGGSSNTNNAFATIGAPAPAPTVVTPPVNPLFPTIGKQGLAPVIAKSVAASPIDPTENVASERANRIAQGLPVSVNTDKAAPSFGGGIVRAIINPFASIVQSAKDIGTVIAGPNADQAKVPPFLAKLQTDTNYLGTVKRVGSTFDPAKGFTAPENVAAVKDAAGKALDIVSNLVGESGVTDAVKTSMEGLIKEALIRGGKTGAIAGGAQGAGNALENNGSAKDVAIGTGEGAIAGAIFGATLDSLTAIGGHAVSKATELYNSLTPAEREAGFVRNPLAKEGDKNPLPPDATPQEILAKAQADAQHLGIKKPLVEADQQEIPKINPEQSTKLTPEQVAPLAKSLADTHWDEVQAPALAEGKATVVGADNFKDHFGNDYNDNNHPAYSQAAFLEYERALKENPSDKVILTGGGPASGKTELLVKNLVKDGFDGTIYDSNMANYDGVVKQIKMARDAGKDIEIRGVLPNLENARTFSIQREAQMGRGISDATFARGHSGFPDVLQKLLENGIVSPDEVKLLDTRTPGTFQEAVEKVNSNRFVQNPLETLKSLGYTEDGIKKTYAKENFDGTGTRRSGSTVREGSSTTLGKDRTDQGPRNGQGDRGLLLGNQEKPRFTNRGTKDVDQIRSMIDRERRSLAAARENPEAHAKAYGADAPAKYEARITQLKERLRDATPELKDSDLIPKRNIDKDRITAEKSATAKKAFDDGLKRTQELDQKATQKSLDVYDAKNKTPQRMTLFKSLKEALFPSKYLDPETREIFSKWENGIIKARDLANKEVGTLSDVPKGRVGFQTMLDYEVGKPTKYTKEIKTAFDSLFNEAKARGLDTEYRENYLPHVYSEDAKEIAQKVQKFLTESKGMTVEEAAAYVDGQKLAPSQARRLALTPFFDKERTFPTYEVAMQYGLTPKFTHPDQLVAYYREQLERALANRQLINSLIDKNKLLTVEDAPNSWKAVDLSFSPRGYYAEPKLARTLNALFNDPAAKDFGQRFFTGAAKTSKFLQEMALSGGVPNTNINFYSIGQAIKDITAGKFSSATAWFRANFNDASVRFLKSNQDIIDKMADNGIDLSSNITSYKNAYKNIVQHDNESFLKKTYSIVGEKFDKLFNEKTFNSYMPQVQVQLFKSVYEKAIADKLPEDVASKLAGDTTKAFYGIIDKQGRAAPTENVISSVFFAPKFREGIVNTLFNTVKSVTSELKNPVFRNNRKLFAGMVVTYAMYNALNKKLNGNYMWQNPAGHETALRIPGKGDNVSYIEFMPSFLSFARNIFSGGLAVAKGDLPTAESKFSSLLSMPIQIMTQVFTNKDYFGNPIYNDTDSHAQQIGKIAAYMGLQTTHPYVQQAVRTVQGKQPLYQAITNAFEIPIKYSTLSTEQKTQYYNMLDQHSQDLAIEKNKMLPTYTQVQQLISEGRTDEAQTIVDGLSDDDYAEYKKLKTAETTQQNTVKKQAMVTTVQQVRALQAKGDDAGAKAIVDGLSDADYKVYTSVAKMFPTDSTQTPQVPTDEPIPQTGVIHAIATYAKAIGSDPVTAFNRIFTGQHIRRVDNGAIIVDRMSLAASEAESRKQAGKSNTTGMRLDHTVPLELGGSNTESNLKLVPEATWASYTPVENYLGKQLRAGNITKKEAQDTILRFKSGLLSASDIIK